MVGRPPAELAVIDLVLFEAFCWEVRERAMCAFDIAKIFCYNSGMNNVYVREDGRYSRTFPIRLPQEVIEVYEKKAEAEDMTVGMWIKRLLVKLSGVAVKYDGTGAIIKKAG